MHTKEAIRRAFDMDTKVSIGAYWHKRSTTYDKFPASHSEEEERTAYRNVLKRFLNGRKLKILDVGTGTGFIALMLAEMGHDTTGLDLAEGMLDRARQKTEGNGHLTHFQLGDAENLPFEDNSFDAIVCRYLLWTLSDPWKALREWYRVVRPGGSIICIEGQWQNSSLKGRLRRLSRQFGILLYEKTNPRKLGYDKKTASRLPFHNGFTLEEGVALFEKTGIYNVSVENLCMIRNVQARNMPLLYRLAMPPPSFLIKGERR
jgi:ubiquinone/menaquinone biosynthesis C-methylase UbiE